MKARRRGRPPKLNADRFPNGKIKPEWSTRETERDIKSVALEARKRIHGLDNATDLAGYTLGRIYLDKNITHAMLEAGDTYALDVWRCYKDMGARLPIQRAQALGERCGPSYMPDENETQIERAQRAAVWLKNMRARLNAVGHGVEGMTFNTCVVGEEQLRMMPPAQFDMLRRGLTALIWFYGIPNERLKVV